MAEKKLKIVAFLQNQWFKDPPRMERMLATTFKGDRERFIRTLLFYRCLTGKRLKAALGETWCDHIIWEESSPKMAAKASGCFEFDTSHMLAVIQKHNPEIIITFGKIATAGMLTLINQRDEHVARCTHFIAPHPAARHATVMDELRAIRRHMDNLNSSPVGGVA